MGPPRDLHLACEVLEAGHGGADKAAVPKRERDAVGHHIGELLGALPERSEVLDGASELGVEAQNPTLWWTITVIFPKTPGFIQKNAPSAIRGALRMKGTTLAFMEGLGWWGSRRQRRRNQRGSVPREETEQAA